MNPKSKKEYKFLGNFKIGHSDFSRFYLNENEIQKQDATALLNLDNDSIFEIFITYYLKITYRTK